MIPHQHSALYDGYMRSGKWQRKRWRKFGQVGARCEACGSRVRLQVHHRTYVRLGHERLRDLRVVCEVHHEEIGRLHAHGLALDVATDRVVPCRGWLRRRLRRG